MHNTIFSKDKPIQVLHKPIRMLDVTVVAEQLHKVMETVFVETLHEIQIFDHQSSN